MPLQSYTQLRVWNHSLSLVSELYRITALLPADERFGLVAQLRRAVISVCANIAEGYGRRTKGEYVNQLSVARGSTNEISALLTISVHLNFLSGTDVESAERMTDQIGGMLWRMMERLK